jgi:hypothetical protein
MRHGRLMKFGTVSHGVGRSWNSLGLPLPSNRYAAVG